MFDVARIRKDFPILDREVNGKPLIYIDSASTTQKPTTVIDAVSDYYRTINANVHRGAYTLAEEATTAYEEARAKVAGLINAPAREVVFTRGTTTGINHIAIGWALRRLKKGDRVLLTIMEHHSNIVPWQLIADLTGAQLVYLDLDDGYEVDLSGLDGVLDESVKVVSMSGMSNVTGTIGACPRALRSGPFRRRGCRRGRGATRSPLTRRRDEPRRRLPPLQRAQDARPHRNRCAMGSR